MPNRTSRQANLYSRYHPFASNDFKFINWEGSEERPSNAVPPTGDLTLYAGWDKQKADYKVNIYLQKNFDTDNPVYEDTPVGWFMVENVEIGTVINEYVVNGENNPERLTAKKRAQELTKAQDLNETSHGYECVSFSVDNGKGENHNEVSESDDTVVNLYYNRAVMTVNFCKMVTTNETTGNLYHQEYSHGIYRYFKLTRLENGYYKYTDENGDDHELLSGTIRYKADIQSSKKGLYGGDVPGIDPNYNGTLLNNPLVYDFSSSVNAFDNSGYYYYQLLEANGAGQPVEKFTGEYINHNTINVVQGEKINTIVYFYNEKLSENGEKVYELYDKTFAFENTHYSNVRYTSLGNWIKGFKPVQYLMYEVNKNNPYPPTKPEPPSKDYLTKINNNVPQSNNEYELKWYPVNRDDGLVGTWFHEANKTYLLVKNDRIVKNLIFKYQDSALGNWQQFDQTVPVRFEDTIADKVIPFPADKAVPGYKFGGWYLDENFETPVDGKTMDTDDITLYAKMVPGDFLVKVFYLNGDEDANFTVKSGTVLSKQEYQAYFSGKTKDGYPLIDYYKDQDLTQQWDWNSPVNIKTATKVYTDTSNNNTAVGELTLYAKYEDSGFAVKYVNPPYAGGDEIHRDPVYSSRTDKVTTADAPKASFWPDSQKFVCWTLKDGTEIQEIQPGDTFSYSDSLAEDEMEAVQGSDKKVKVITVTAKYEPIATIVIPWYVGYGSKRAFHVDTVPEGDDTKSRLAVNETVDIQKAPERTGYTFLGWARVDMDNVDTEDEARSWMADVANYNKENLDEDNLFLNYNIEDGKFYSTYSDETDEFDGEVTKIAADRKTYQAMFAVWKEVPTFTIVHSSDGEREVVNVPKTRGGEPIEFNITKKVRDGFLYGGYYQSNSIDYDKGASYDEPGTAIPVIPDEDTVFYLKEVDPNYLKPQLFMVYFDTDSPTERTIKKWFGLVNIDSAGKEDEGENIVEEGDYVKCGLIIKDEKGDEVFEDSTGIVAQQIIAKKGGKTYLTMDRDSFGPAFNTDTGELGSEECYLGCIEIDTEIITKGAELQIAAYYQTQDGVRVTGSKVRMIKFADEDPVTFTGWTSNSNNGNTKTGIRQMASTATDVNKEPGRSLHVQKVIEIETQDKNEYNVTKFYGTDEMKPQTVEPGDNTGRITYESMDGYLFAGWYMDEGLSVPADFSDVRGDMTVYASYIPRKDVTLSLARKKGKTGDVTFTATVSVKNTNKFAEVGVSCSHNGELSEEALTKKTYVNVGSSRSPKYTYKFSGPVEVKGLEATDSFTASAYWVTKDGTRVTEAARTCTYKGGSVKVQN